MVPQRECKCIKLQCMCPIIDAVRRQISLRCDWWEGEL